VEGYQVEPDEAGLRSAVRAILKRIDRRKTLSVKNLLTDGRRGNK
jgi:hypothetical protein